MRSSSRVRRVSTMPFQALFIKLLICNARISRSFWASSISQAVRSNSRALLVSRKAPKTRSFSAFTSAALRSASSAISSASCSNTPARCASGKLCFTLAFKADMSDALLANSERAFSHSSAITCNSPVRFARNKLLATFRVSIFFCTVGRRRPELSDKPSSTPEDEADIMLSKCAACCSQCASQALCATGRPERGRRSPKSVRRSPSRPAASRTGSTSGPTIASLSFISRGLAPDHSAAARCFFARFFFDSAFARSTRSAASANSSAATSAAARSAASSSSAGGAFSPLLCTLFQALATSSIFLRNILSRNLSVVLEGVGAL
mmetsp:Transcript_17052/g.49440  ORF Transcript_17052/g.49440 Transcript_17052/m.49440 type:complete len:322 (-) Transcript_17052:500-1465(-)